MLRKARLLDCYKIPLIKMIMITPKYNNKDNEEIKVLCQIMGENQK